MTTFQDLWIFGYGSLMWRPGFDFAEQSPALIDGWHRSFCLWSRRHRGTAAKPGLVLGLDRGGSCRGAAFRVQGARVQATLDYLADRELDGYAYEARMLPVNVESQGTVMAYTFVADPSHGQYAGKVPLERAASIIMDAEGEAGLNRDYLINTVRQIEADGHRDPELHALLVEVERQTGEIEQGAGI